MALMVRPFDAHPIDLPDIPHVPDFRPFGRTGFHGKDELVFDRHGLGCLEGPDVIPGGRDAVTAGKQQKRPHRLLHVIPLSALLTTTPRVEGPGFGPPTKGGGTSSPSTTACTPGNPQKILHIL